MVFPTLPTIHIAGGSHAVKLYHSLVKNKSILTKFNVKNLAKSGATYDTLSLPKVTEVKENDYLILFTYGNDCLKKNVKITYLNQKRVFHLTKFEPNSLIFFKNILKKLEIYSNKITGKIYVIDCVKRHMRCCTSLDHKFTNLLKHQKLWNQTLKEYFMDSNVIVLSHLDFLPYTKNWLKNNYNYSTLLTDSVHLKPELYDYIAQGVFNILK